jgi:hypothetical protein
MNNFAQVIGVLTISNLWIGNKIWTEKDRVVFERPQGVPLVPEKEYAPEDFSAAELMDGATLGAATVNLQWHILQSFPRALIYFETGSYLLRNSFPGHDFSADALLNFFKIGELVTAAMYSTNPKLDDIQRASRELSITGVTDEEIATFYKIRGRDAAHDWLSAEQVKREDAVDCKNWAHMMMIYHWREKGYDIVALSLDEPRLGRGVRQASDAIQETQSKAD